MTNRSQKLVAATLVAIGLLTAVMPAAATTEDPVRAALETNVAEGFPGAVAYVRDGGRERHYGVGLANLVTGEKATPKHRFRTASLTKTFTATVVLQLVGAGELTLDDTLGELLPEVVRGHSGEVTVRQLLDHSSGIHDPASTHEFFRPYLEQHRWGHVIRPAEVVRQAMAHEPEFRPPGSAVRYSNTNYVLAGLIVERITGHSFGTELRRRILQPLHLGETSFPTIDPFLSGKHLRGYDAQREDRTVFSPSYDWAAGAIVSTVDDLAKFQQVLLSGALLPAKEQGQLVGLGLGLQRIPLPCPDGPREAIGHQGSGPGYFTFAFTSGKRQAVLAFNSFDLTADIDRKQPYPGSQFGVLKTLSAALCGPLT